MVPGGESVSVGQRDIRRSTSASCWRKPLTDWAEWLATSDDSPVARFTPAGSDLDGVFDVKVVYQQRYEDVDLSRVPEVFLPRVGPFQVIDYEKVYAVDPKREDIFDARGIDRPGA